MWQVGELMHQWEMLAELAERPEAVTSDRQIAQAGFRARFCNFVSVL